MALSDKSKVWAYGNNKNLELGFEFKDQFTTPAIVSHFQDDKVEQFDMSESNSIALLMKNGQQVFTFGNNVRGNLGNPFVLKNE